MRQLWANAPTACGDDITVNRYFLYDMLLRLARESFEDGYLLGAEHTLQDARGELPVDLDYPDVRKDW